MRLVFFLLMLAASQVSFASIKFCGSLSNVAYETDIFTVIRMGLVNDKNEPSYLTVKDSAAITAVISVVTENPNYSHDSDMDDYRWNAAEPDGNPNRYFVCVTGSELRKHKGYFYLDQVLSLEVWKNGQKK